MKAQFTKLYKANRHKMHQEERKEFVHELQRVIDSKEYILDWGNESKLDSSFFWSVSPQGFRYWERWAIKFQEPGYY